MKLNYEELAKSFIEQLGGNINKITLSDYLNEYQEFVNRNRAAKTAEGVKLVGKYLLEYFSPIKPIDTIELKNAEGFIDVLKKRAPNGVYIYHRVLKSMFNKAIEWNYMRVNPFLKVKLPKKQEKPPAFITAEELNKITVKLDREFIRDIVEVSFYTGMRLGEATFLKWKNISLGSNTIIIGDDSFNTKTRKSRSIPIHPRVKEILERKKNEGKSKKENFVFRKSGNQPYTGDYISKKFKKACREAGIDEEVHYHTLRHSTASLLSQKGVSIYTIQKILGHSSINTTQIYAHLQIDTLRDAINQLN